MIRRFLLLTVNTVLLLALAASLERRAFAYVDPGTGLLLFQSAGAAVSGVLFYFRRRLKRLFKLSPSEHPRVGSGKG